MKSVIPTVSPLSGGKPFNLETAVEQRVKSDPLGVGKGALIRNCELFRQGATSPSTFSRRAAVSCRSRLNVTIAQSRHAEGACFTHRVTLDRKQRLVLSQYSAPESIA